MRKEAGSGLTDRKEKSFLDFLVGTLFLLMRPRVTKAQGFPLKETSGADRLTQEARARLETSFYHPFS